ncbi:hypothetical protein GF314_10070 [bacterium]|nr:hypothetical protein [bacterium]
MRHLLPVVLVVVALSAQAQQYGDYGGTMGVYFSDTEFTDETANLTTPPIFFEAYIVLTDAQIANVGAYELEITLSAPDALILQVHGPNGWLNFGDLEDHMAGYADPVLVDADGAAVLCTLECFYPGTDQVDVIMGGSSLESIPGWDGPVILEVPNFEILLVCHLSSGAVGHDDAVAWLNREVVAAESASWSQVKSLF